MMNSTISAVVAGDLCMRAPLNKIIGSGEESSIFEDIRPVLEDADVRLVNLENPLLDSGTPIPKSGPNLFSPEAGISILKAAKFDAAILANNHIGDFGNEGILRTLDILDAQRIGHTGAGVTLVEARKPWIAKRNGLTLAVLAAAENEFGIATANKPGSNGLDLCRLCDDIDEAARQNDFVLVAMHGGNEYCPVPAQVVVDRYRTLINAGADAVIGMHPHCPQGYEIYKEKPIVYSTGNFLFCDLSKTDPHDSWYYGYFPLIVFSGKTPKMTPRFYRFTADGRRIELLTGEEKENMQTYLENISALIKDSDRLMRYYESWCVYKGQEFANWLHYKPTGFMDAAIDLAMLTLRNAFTCEAHNDLLKTYLRILCDGRLEECARGIPDVLALQKIPK